VLEQQARRRRVRVAAAFALGQAVDELGQVEAPLGVDVGEDLQAVQRDLAEGPRPAQQAGELEVDQQAPEAHDRPPFGLGEREARELELEEERVEAYRAHAGAALELARGELGDGALEVARQGVAAEHRVEREQRGERDEEPGAGDPAQPLFHRGFPPVALKNV
jgi:hypothetical protein